MKKYNLILAMFLILLIQKSNYGQENVDFFTVGVDPKAEEIKEMRTNTSRTYLNSDGSFTAVIAPFGDAPPISPYWISPRYYHTSTVWDNYKFSPYGTALGYSYEDPNLTDGIDRVFLQWNTSIIPDDAIIQSTKIVFSKFINNTSATTINLFEVASTHGYYPPTDDAQDMYNDCNDGTSFGSISVNSGGADVNYDGTNDFNNKLKTKLTSDWMGMGMKNAQESDHSYFLAFYTSSGYLVVNYNMLKVTPSGWTNVPGDGATQTGFMVEYMGTGTKTYSINVITGSDWIETSPTSGTTTGYFSITAKANYSGNQRMDGLIRISASGVPDLDMLIKQPNYASTLTLPTQQISGYQTYKVTNWIEANNFLVGSGGNIGTLDLYAGNKINLKPGFHAKSDAGTFHARIQSLGDNMELTGNSDEKDSKKILALKEEKTSSSKEKTSFQSDNIPVDPIPTEYDLFQNYPNPFNPNTTIRFALPEKAVVKIAVFNLLGQQVAEIANTELNAGYHSVNFNGSALSSGIYLYRISTEKFSKTLKLLLVK